MNDLSARVARLKLIGELLSRKKLLSETSADARIERLKLVRRMLEIRKILGAASPPADTAQEEPPVAIDEGPEDATYEEVGESRNPAARFYDFNPNRKPAQRRRENATAIALLRQIRAGEVDGDNLNDDQRATLARYSGTGGALEGEDGKKGSAYEYYTPKPIAQGAWELLREMGFAGGKVLDPCAGTGIFGGTAPADAAVDAVELNQTSGEVNALVNKGPGYTCTVSPFERVAASTPDEIYDAVITNVPFGDKSARGGNELADTRYRGEPLEGYFILRSLEKLKPGGLALFITPHRTVSGKGGTEVSIRRRASLMAEFMGAYRLPSNLFLSAGAETITDIVVFRKHGAEVAEKIAELEEQAPSKLVEARVCWTEFIEGGYFAGEGRKFVLGEFKAADPEKRRGKFGDIDRVLSDKTPVEVAKLLRRFGGSRIDWDVLKATETMPIVYADGDTITQAGQTLQLRDGAWAVVKAVDDEGGAMAALGAKLADPLAAFTARVPWQEASAYVAFMRRMSRHGDIPKWLASAAAGLQRLAGEGARAQGWHAGITALSVQQVFEYHQADGGTDYASQYPDLTTEMQRCAGDMGALPAAAGDMIRGACALVRTLYTRKRGLSGVWTGQRAAEAADTRTDTQRFEAAKYGAGDVWVDLAKAREVFGEDFDPVADDAWCLSPDGQRVARADDVFIGNLGDALRRLEADAKAATDERVRGKILAQIAEAQRRVQRVDVSQMGFNLFSPFVTLEERCEFMRKFVDPGFGIVWDEDSGEMSIEFTVNDSKLDTVARAEDKKLFRRMAIYLRNSTVTLGTAEFGDRERAMSRLRELTQSSNEQFSAWCRSNPEIIGRLQDRANDPDRLYFDQADDQSPLPLPGMRIGTPPDGITPHGYQFAFVRKSGREFGGINGMQVGLGKTLTSLACVQHAHNIGSKKRTMFVVPNSVLSNWRKEASGAYQSLDDCLFVGLSTDKNGKPRVRAQDYDADLMRIFEGRHSKIFLTFEAFERLRLKDETVAGFEAYMREVDASFAESMGKKDDERAAGKVKRLAAVLSEGKKASTPFLEDLGVDSIVIDEAHAFKASAAAASFEAAKYLALSETSARGIDMQAKAWFIRGLSAKGDGVMPLTATPITNSPLEIYAMMSLGAGHRRVNDMALGCKGADEFLNLVCRVESEMDETMDGIVRETRVFTGLDNVHVLRGMIGACATVETTETVGMAVKVPGMAEQETPVAMPEPPTINMLKDYKAAYRYAADKLSNRGENRGDPGAFDRIQAKFGEPLELIAHPFNLIRKMELLIMDPELDQRATFFATLPDDAGKVADIVAKFNALKIIEERPRPGPRTAADAIVGEKTKKVGDEKVVVLRVHARAIIDGKRVVLDTIDPETIARFEELADAAGVDLDVTVPPKLAALVANVRAEEMNPRGVDDDGNPTPRVKQIIFCDILPLHRKIRRLLVRRAGVPAGQIAIITGKTNNKPEQIQAVQDGFNAHGEDNVYRYVIANEKAEVGINLQRGTQAIHHLTIGWTPDSLTQRNGRGARQGNKTETVTVYYYDADGTFDANKRTLVARKASWIDEVMDPVGGTSVDIESGMSREQLEALIDTVGDQDAMSRFTEGLAQKEKAAREEGTRGKQATNLRTVLSQQAFLKANPTVQDWCAGKLRRLVEMTRQADKMQARIDDPKASASALLRNQQTMAAMQAEMRGLGAEIDATLTLYPAGKYGGFNRHEPITASDLARKLIHDAGKKAVSMDVINAHCRSGSTLKAGGPLEVEWRSEVDMAKAMLEQSARRAAELSAGENAIPAAVVESFVQGKGAFIDGKAVVDGAILETKDEMHLVTDSGASILGWSSRPARLPIGSTSGAVTVHLPGAASFEEAARRAAAFEDEKVRAAKTISELQMGDTFAANSAEIAKYRVERTRIPVTTQETVLPAPYFPVPIHPSRVKPEMIALARIVAHQAEIVSWDGLVGSVAADAGTSRYQPKPGSYSPGRPFLPDLAAYAAAHSLKVSVGEAQAVGLGHQSGWSLAEAFRVKPEAPFDVASHTTVEALNQAIEAHLIAHHPHLQVDKDMTLATLESMSTHGYAVSRRRRELLAVAQRDAAAAPTPAPPAQAPAAAPPSPPPPPPVPVAAASVTAQNPVAPETIPDDQVVGIRGDTRPVKDDIKKACYDVGSTPQWNGDAVMWGVPFKAWKLLLERFPDMGKRLSLCEFQAKSGAKAYSSAPRSPYASTYRRR